MVVAGEQVVVGDVTPAGSDSDPTIEDADLFSSFDGDLSINSGSSAGTPAVIAYEVLCRRHHMRRQTAATAVDLSERPDTVDLDRVPAVR